MGLGELPLSFAACTNQIEMVRLLLEFGADICEVDSEGNTIFHHLIRCENLGMYEFLVDYYRNHNTPSHTKENTIMPWERQNDCEMTPFTYSAFLGNEKMFCALLERRRELQWKYGSVSCFLYPIDDLDTPLPESPYQRQPALHWIVHNAHLNLLRHTRIAELLRKKWDRFAERIFLRKLIFTIIYLFAFSLSSILRPRLSDHSSSESDSLSDPIYVTSDPISVASIPTENTLSPPPPSPLSSPYPFLSIFDSLLTNHSLSHSELFFLFLYLITEIVLIVGAINKFHREIREMFRVGVSAYWGCHGAPFVENFTSSSFVVVLFVSYSLEFSGGPGATLTRSIAGVLAYAYVVFFLLGFRLTGPFLVIVGRMACVDLVRFFLLFSVFLFGFTQAFFILFEEEGSAAFIERIRRCFMVILGELDADEYTKHWLGIFLFSVYVIIVVILLLNLLIAEMGDTYSKGIDEADRSWLLERARIIFSIEHEMSSEERQSEENRYWVTINGLRYIQVEEIDEEWGREDKDEEPLTQIHATVQNLLHRLNRLEQSISAHSTPSSLHPPPTTPRHTATPSPSSPPILMSPMMYGSPANPPSSPLLSTSRAKKTTIIYK
jgi:hypothetical protein